MKITKVQTDEGHIVEAYGYYASPGEMIYRVEGRRPFFIHMTPKAVLFCSQELSRETFAHLAEAQEIQGLGNFNKYFNEMVNNTTEDTGYKENYDIINQCAFAPPVMIGGCAESGTTLLLNILKKHNNLHVLPNETHAFYPKPFRLRQLARTVVSVQDKRWVEMTPKHVLAFRDIYAFFKKSVKLIHVVRDGRDVITVKDPNNDKKFLIDKKDWIKDVGGGFKYEYISHIVKYEDLVLHPKETVEGICEYIEEPFEESLMDYTNDLNTNIAEWDNPEYKDRIESFMSDPEASELMKQLGYSEGIEA